MLLFGDYLPAFSIVLSRKRLILKKGIYIIKTRVILLNLNEKALALVTVN